MRHGDCLRNEIVDHGEPVDAECRLQLVAGEAPGIVGEADHRCVDWRCHGDDRLVQLRRLPRKLGQIGPGRLSQARVVAHPEMALGSHRAAQIVVGGVSQREAGIGPADVRDQSRHPCPFADP
jgi:hypothetical protein